MGLSESLGNLYMKVEDAYYGVLDFFEEKGIGLPWSYNDFLESKGIPALPFTFALIFLLLASVFVVYSTGQPITSEFTLSLKDDKGRSLDDVRVQIFDEEGNLLKELTASDGQTISLDGIHPDSILKVVATKSGYGEKSGLLNAGDSGLKLSLQGDNDAIVGRLKLIDSETGTTLKDVIVDAEWVGSDGIITATPATDGIILLNVPLNAEISIVAKAPNYEDLHDTIIFTSGDIKIKEMLPKASASSGPSVVLVKAIDDATKLPIEDVHITITHAQSNEIITEIDAPTGIHSETLQKGTPIRVTVEKEGYLTYTSQTDFPGGKTLREDEEVIIATMKNGGTNLLLRTKNANSQQPIDSVGVDLLDESYELIDSQLSNFSGEASFGGLNQVNTYYVTGFHPNFLPLRTLVDWPSLEQGEDEKAMDVLLVPFTSGNAGILTVFVNESDGKAAANASVSVDELVEGQYLPLIVSKSTDSAGSFTARIPINTSIRVRAEKGEMIAEQELVVAAGLNKVVLTLSSELNLVDFTFQLSNGQSFAGNILITNTSGGSIFDESITDGKADVIVDSLNDTVNITATSADGKKFTQTIAIAGRNAITVVLDAAPGPAGPAPVVQYVGLFDASGEPVPGLSPLQDGFARFTIQWPTGATNGGLFVRVGPENISNVDSQFVGIVGLNGEADSISYGRTYTATPKPGNESKDRKSAGKAGSLSKWIEIVKKTPTGTTTFDVRLKARTGSPTGAQEIRFRAFAEINQTIARTPADNELGASPYTKDKLGLYAATQTQSIPVYATLPLCQNGICVNVSFVDEESHSYSLGGFQAVEGKPYAMHLEILPSLSAGSTPSIPKEGLVTNTAINAAKTGTTIKAQTSEDALLVFTKSEIGNFGKLADNGNKDTSITFSIPAIDPQFGSQARIHFTPQELGQTTISLSVVSSNAQWAETIPVEIVQAKLLRVVMPDQVNPNEPFTISVMDEQGNPITDALISLYTPDGKFVASIKGKNLPGKGANGQYSFDKALEPGLYNVKVKVPGYVDYEDTLNVGLNNPLQIDEKIAVEIPFGQTKTTQNIVVTNTTNYPISNITAEFKEYDTFPKEIQLAFEPLPAIPAKGKGNIVVTATYAGNPTDTSVLSGGGSLSVRGEINALLPVTDTAILSATYNKQLDASCLTFDKTRVAVTLMGEAQPYGNMYENGSQVNDTIPYYGDAYQPNPYSYTNNGYNAYGVDSYGSYQNAENKRVSVKATNKCGVELLLIPGVSTIDGQLEVDGLKVAAVDSQLKLQNGEQKQVDFTLTNQLFRAGYAPQMNQYALTFRAAQLNASIPLDIQFWDRSRALQTPQTIELTLIKNGTTKATDRVIVPITNIGASPIYDLRATIEGTEPEGVDLKLENNHPYSQTVNNVNTAYAGGSYQGGYFDSSAALQPGQTQHPPVAIIGESLSETEGVEQLNLQITGRVGSQRTLLKTIPIYLRTGHTSCLEIRAFDTPISFVSSEITGTLSKRVTISNNCLEPVRITQVNPATINGNTLSIVSAEGTDTLEKDEEAEFNLSLSKGNAYKANLPFTIKGIMLLTNKSVESNPLTLEIALGENELARANVTNPVQVPVCEGGTMDVRFPLLASKNECSQAYCDAEQASNMLSNLIEQQITKINQQLQAKKNDATQFKNCELTKGYCTFAQLGIKSSSIDLYLQNDTLTSNMLAYVMRDGTYPRLSSMQSQVMTELVGDTADDAFAQRLGTGLGNMVFIPPLSGCGKYTISILGSVENVANQLQPDAINIAVKIVTPKQKTAECQDKIYNAANFLPKNRSLTAQNSQQTLLGLVEYENALQTPAETLAETVFGSKDRAVQNTGSNRMTLQSGVLSGAIVELSLDPQTYGDGPKNIVTTIQEVGGQIPNEAAIEAGKIITALGSSAKVVNGCITKDEQTWRISSVPNIGKFVYQGCALPGTPEGGLTLRPNLTCCLLTTQSPVASEVTYTLDPSGTDPIAGVQGLDLYEKKDVGNNTALVEPGAKLSYGSTYPLVFDTKNQVYQKELVMCATSDPQTQQQANRTKVQTSATRTLDGVKAGPLAFELRTCSLDADDALAKSYSKGNGVWYATVDWDDPVSSKTLKQVIQEISDGKKTPDAFFAYQDQGILASENPVYQEKFKEKQRDSLIGYGIACGAACGVCTGLTTIGTGGLGSGLILDCLLGCGLPVGVGVAGIYGEDALESSDGTPLEGPAKVFDSTVGAVGRYGVDLISTSPENEPAADALVAGESYATLRGLIKLKKQFETNKIAYADEEKKIAAEMAEQLNKTKELTASADYSNALREADALRETGEGVVQIAKNEAAEAAANLTQVTSELEQLQKVEATAAKAVQDAEAALSQANTIIATKPSFQASEYVKQLSADRIAAQKALDSAHEASTIAQRRIQLAQTLQQNALDKLNLKVDMQHGIETQLDELESLRSTVPQTVADEVLGSIRTTRGLNHAGDNLNRLKNEWEHALRKNKTDIHKIIGIKHTKSYVEVAATSGGTIKITDVQRVGDEFVFSVTGGLKPTMTQTELIATHVIPDQLKFFEPLTAARVLEFRTRFDTQLTVVENEIDNIVDNLDEIKREYPSIGNTITKQIEDIQQKGAVLSQNRATILNQVDQLSPVKISTSGGGLFGGIRAQTEISVENARDAVRNQLSSTPSSALQDLDQRVDGLFDNLTRLKYEEVELHSKIDRLGQLVDNTKGSLIEAENARHAANLSQADLASSLDDAIKSRDATLAKIAELEKANPELVATIRKNKEALASAKGNVTAASDLVKEQSNVQGIKDDLLKGYQAEMDSIVEEQKSLLQANEFVENPPAASAPAPGVSKGKGLVKEFAKGFVCSGVGNLAGFFAYREGLEDEVENKISLNAGSGNVLDASTSNLIFQKGQTYKFTVGPGAGSGKSNSVSIDIVDPTTLLPANAWLDDCSQK